MKKSLSLVLALVMTVSLFTFGPVSASAAFTDSNSITYKEAVDVISSLEIMGGYSDGSFRPNGALTRGAAAKIICNMMLTPQIANNMSNNTGTRFSDVPAGHVFAGYIAWCVQENIVSGYSDGSFHPGDPLSTQAFLKMLLCALGYDQTIEHYTGSGWSNNVTNQALMIGLNNGLAATLTGTANVNRQDACLFAFNALKSDLVEYTGTRNTRSVRTTTANRGTNIVAEASSPYTLQFAEQYFSDLKQTSNTTDAFGCPATKWTLKNSDVGTYLATVDKVYYNEDVTAGQVYNDLNLSINAPLTVYVNGVDVTNSGATISR
ncbi:MAG: S-layer homology domain-containing protein, partial [Oscillibacter sp.]|nr:S-layer homology domain-containing protein [Oscillibacter sp.]